MFASNKELRNLLERVPRLRGGALDKAMEAAKDLYEREARPEALKVLVVIMDKKVYIHVLHSVHTAIFALNFPSFNH